MPGINTSAIIGQIYIASPNANGENVKKTNGADHNFFLCFVLFLSKLI